MRHPVYQRLRPFLRRDLRARLTSALVSIFVLTALTWLGVSALSKIDSREAHQLRVDVGLEDDWRGSGTWRQALAGWMGSAIPPLLIWMLPSCGSFSASSIEPDRR